MSQVLDQDQYSIVTRLSILRAIHRAMPVRSQLCTYNATLAISVGICENYTVFGREAIARFDAYPWYYDEDRFPCYDFLYQIKLTVRVEDDQFNIVRDFKCAGRLIHCDDRSVLLSNELFKIDVSDPGCFDFIDFLCQVSDADMKLMSEIGEECRQDAYNRKYNMKNISQR